MYTLRQALLLDDGLSCRQRLLQYMQAVADELVLPNINSSKPPASWRIDTILDEFHDLADRSFAIDPLVRDNSDVLRDIKPEMVVMALSNFDTTNLDSFMLPGLPFLSEGHKVLSSKASAMRRWMEMTSDGSVAHGKYEREVQLLRKYIGDVLIGMYENKLQVTLVPDFQVEQVERIMAVNALDRYWRDHLVNMNRLRAAVNVRCFGHMNPLEEYKIDGCRFFIAMLSASRRLTVESLLQPWVADGADRSEFA